MKGKLFKRVTALLSTAAMLLTYADFSAIDFSVHAENGDEPMISNYDLNGDGDYDDVGECGWGYELDSADDLYWFADRVINNGERNLNAFLTKDITINSDVLINGELNTDGEFKEWTPVGDNDGNSFLGTFEGGGHTISGLYINSPEENAGNRVGLFGYNNGTIKNVCIADSYIYGYSNVGSICGINNSHGTIENCCNSGVVKSIKKICGGICGRNTSTITNCFNTGEVEGLDDVGGICGHFNYEGIIKSCFNTGKVSGNSNIGGVCGKNDDNSTIKNCYNTGTVTGATKVGGISGEYTRFVSVDPILIENCYNIGMVSGDTSVGSICGVDDENVITNCYYLKTEGLNVNLTGKGNGDDVSGLIEAKSAGQFASGEVCWLLNVEQSDNPVFYQNIGKDISPVLDKHHTVIKNGESYKNNAHSYENGFCTVCGYEPADAVTDVTDIDGDGDTAETVYEISNAGQLYWFAGLVNGTLGDVEQTRSANAVLKNDITVNSGVFDEDGKLNEGDFREWTPIGTYTSYYDKSPYSGTFNGNNKTISGLYFNNDSQGNVGLFGGVDSGTIKNVTVADSYFCGSYNVGSICGYIEEGTIENCYNTGDVSGSYDVGGVCGCAVSANIKECSNTGDVTATSEYAYVGGVCGDNYEGTLSNCYNKGTVIGDDSVGGVCGCAVSANINECSNAGTVEGEEEVGGICGCAGSANIKECSNAGTVEGDDSVGGICGFAESADIKECSNAGTAEGYESVGGICGYSAYSTIENSFNINNVINMGDSDVEAVTTTPQVTTTETTTATETETETTPETTDSEDLSVNSFGCVCGDMNSSYVIKCYSSGKIVNEISRNECIRNFGNIDEGVIITDFYYLTDTDDGNGGKTAQQFASGEVCWLLNGGKTQAESPVFFQNIDKEAFPILDSTHHTVVEKDGAYSNEHNFESEICTICGAFEDGMGAKLAGHSLTLDGSIGVNFYMVLDKSVAEDENAYMRFTLPNGKTENVKVSQAEKKKVNGTECYVFKCNVAAKEMTATIKAQMFSNGKQGTVYDYTVKEYADYLFANAYEDDGTTVKNQEYAKAYALVEAMVNYGAYSQIYFDYNTNALANADITNKDVSGVTAGTVNKPYNSSVNNLPEGVSLVSANLELESETVLNLLFTNTTDNELTFKTSDDVTLTQTMTADGIKVTITNIAAQRLSEDIIVNISVDGATASYSAMYSPMNYCYSVLSKEKTATRTDELKNVMRAFWLYNAAAVSYFTKSL